MADARYSIMGGGAGGGLGIVLGAHSFTNFTLNASTDQLEFYFQAETANPITQGFVRMGTLAGTTPTYRLSVQGIDASGNADGTIKGGGSPVSKTFSPSGLGWSNNTGHWLTFDNAYTPSVGEFLVLVIDYSSGTIDGSNNAPFTATISTPTNRFPYATQNDAGVRTDVSTGSPCYGYATASKYYGYPAQTANTRTFNSTTGTFDEWGAKFTSPAEWGATYQILGVRIPMALTAAGSSKLLIYGGTDTTAANSTGATTEVTAHQEVTFDHDYTNSTGTNTYTILFTTTPTLYYGATYRFAVQPQGAVNVALQTLTLTAASDQDAYPLGQNASVTKRLDAGNWTDVTDERMAVEFILADITEPSGGASGMHYRTAQLGRV